MRALLVIALVRFIAPDGQRIDINPAEVTSVREPHGGQGHFVPGTNCIIVMSNGKFISVREECEETRRLLGTPAAAGEPPCTLVCAGSR
jgi:hypothetical protein